MRGELRVAAAARRTAAIPKALNDIVMRAMAPAVGDRYQRAGELLDDLLAARTKWVGSRPGRVVAGTSARRGAKDELSEIQGRLRARETPAAALLLALPQAAPLADRPLPVLRRSAVMLESVMPSMDRFFPPNIR